MNTVRKYLVFLLGLSSIGVSANPVALTVPTFAIWDCGSLAPDGTVSQQFPYITIVRNDLKLAVQESFLKNGTEKSKLRKLSKVGTSNSPAKYETLDKSGKPDMKYKFVVTNSSISEIFENKINGRSTNCKKVENKVKH